MNGLDAEEAARYVGVNDRKAEGAHYTPSILAQFVGDRIADAYTSSAPAGRTVRVCDPALGDGELLLALLNSLAERGIVDVYAFGFDTNPAAVKVARERISAQHPAVRLELICGSFLDTEAVRHDRSALQGLFEEAPAEYDLLIANPPYVRTQVMGSAQAQNLARQFGLTGRVDLYHAFLCGIGRVLRPGGVAGVIVSNRFMTTKGGASIRADILEQFHPLHIWDLGDTKLFTAAVLPAVLLLRAKTGVVEPTSCGFSTIYTTKDAGQAARCRNAIDAIGCSGLVDVEGGERFRVEHGTLHAGSSPADVWRLKTGHSDEWLQTVRRHTWSSFGSIGSVRVGVKTTSDKVFLKTMDTWSDEERPELVRPLTTHHIARRFKALEDRNRRAIVYPHVVEDGRRKAADLSQYPRTERYLELNRAVLEARTYVTEAGRHWYEVWVPQDPGAWAFPKLVFRDISEQPMFWMDLSGSVVNGDCYWLSCLDHSNDDLLWLALAVANSTFIETFYDRSFNNKLYSGRRRFMTQYVEQFPLPNPDLPASKRIVEVARRVYDLTPSDDASQLARELNGLVWLSFGVEEVGR